jgi:hypothetical protein
MYIYLKKVVLTIDTPRYIVSTKLKVLNLASSGAGAHGECATFEDWVEAWVEAKGQNFFFYCVYIDPSPRSHLCLARTGYFKTVATIQLVWCFPISAVSTSNS